MASKASIANHPLHPMLVPLPVGLWMFSLICDLVSFVKGDPLWGALAAYTLVGGILGALIAAVPGLFDLLTLPPSPAKKTALWHMIINLSVVVLYLINFLLRRHEAVPGIGPLLLTMVAIMLLGTSGWLGGELVYVNGVAVLPADRKRSP